MTLLFLDRAQSDRSPDVYEEGIAVVSDNRLHYFRSSWSSAGHLSVPLDVIESVNEQQISIQGVVATPGLKPVGLVVTPSRGPTWVLVAAVDAREFFLEQHVLLAAS